jgi:hypothetical protein
VPEAPFDPDYAAFRTMLESLATEGHRLVTHLSRDSSPAAFRRVRGLLRRIDRFDELARARGIETVRRWADRLKDLVLEVVQDR